MSTKISKSFTKVLIISYLFRKSLSLVFDVDKSRLQDQHSLLSKISFHASQVYCDLFLCYSSCPSAKQSIFQKLRLEIWNMSRGNTSCIFSYRCSGSWSIRFLTLTTSCKTRSVRYYWVFTPIFGTNKGQTNVPTHTHRITQPILSSIHMAFNLIGHKYFWV